MDDLKTQVQLLEVEEGDIVLVHAQVLTGELRRTVTAMLPPGAGAIFLAPGESLERLSDEALKAAGLVRAQAACQCGPGGCGKGING